MEEGEGRGALWNLKYRRPPDYRCLPRRPEGAHLIVCGEGSPAWLPEVVHHCGQTLWQAGEAPGYGRESKSVGVLSFRGDHLPVGQFEEQ